MTVTSLIFTIINTRAPQSAKPATAAERKAPAVQADDSGCDHKRPASRQNRFADAMMSALRELGFGGAAASASAAATPAASSTAATAKAPAATAVEAAGATDSSASVESAVQQFAHALFQALRQGGSGNRKADDGDGRVEGHGHRRHGEGRGYGDMAQRLEALSQTVGAPAAAPATVAGAAPAPATAAAATVIAAPVAAAAKNPLLDAFTKLLNTLKPAGTSTAATTPATDMAEKLRQFLHTLAQALAPDTMGSVQRAQVGGMVNVTA